MWKRIHDSRRLVLLSPKIQYCSISRTLKQEIFGHFLIFAANFSKHYVHFFLITDLFQENNDLPCTLY